MIKRISRKFSKVTKEQEELTVGDRVANIVIGASLGFEGAAMTTIGAINATGTLYAVQDGATHVSVFPIGGTLEDWHKAGSSSVWTTSLKSVVLKYGR